MFLVNVSAFLGLFVGSPCLTFSPLLLGRGRNVGVGLWPLDLTFGLLSPALGGFSGGCGFSDTAGALVLLSWRVLCERPSLRWGGLCRCCAVPILCGCVSELCWTFGGAPGALQVVAQVPEAERWCFP